MEIRIKVKTLAAIIAVTTATLLVLNFGRQVEINKRKAATKERVKIQVLTQYKKAYERGRKNLIEVALMDAKDWINK